jgi:hypothetical protein
MKAGFLSRGGPAAPVVAPAVQAANVPVEMAKHPRTVPAVASFLISRPLVVKQLNCSYRALDLRDP